MQAGELHAFVELHIEQGPLLERDSQQIGIVSAIAAPAALRVVFRGDGGHAGALLMPDRNDAGLAAAELALAVEKATLATGVIDTVGTTGRVVLEPNAINSVPRVAHVEIDVRDIDLQRRDGVLKEIEAAAGEIAARRKVEWELEVWHIDTCTYATDTVVVPQIISRDPPATCGQQVVEERWCGPPITMDDVSTGARCRPRCGQDPQVHAPVDGEPRLPR